MFKLLYLLSFLAVTSLISCEKKVPYPNSQTKKSTPTDTLSGKIFTIAGNGYTGGPGGGYSGDGGPAKAAELHAPYGLVVDGLSNLFIADDYNERIRKVNTSGIISTFAGNGTRGYSGDGGLATAAEIYYPEGVAVDGSGNVYFVDNGNNCVRKVSANGIISTFAGIGVPGPGGYGGDGGPATAAELSAPYGLALDGLGNLYIADAANDRIRKVNTSGIISTVAGGGFTNGLGDGGPADSAMLYVPFGVAVDAAGIIYIASSSGNLIRKVNTSNIISTIAGITHNVSLSNNGYSGDGGPATSAELDGPTDIVVDGSGNIYISDANNYCIRKIDPSGIISTYAGNGIGSYSGDGGPATAAAIAYISAMALDGSGNLYIADLYFNHIRVVYK